MFGALFVKIGEQEFVENELGQKDTERNNEKHRDREAKREASKDSLQQESVPSVQRVNILAFSAFTENPFKEGPDV